MAGYAENANGGEVVFEGECVDLVAEILGEGEAVCVRQGLLCHVGGSVMSRVGALVIYSVCQEDGSLRGDVLGECLLTGGGNSKFAPRACRLQTRGLCLQSVRLQEVRVHMRVDTLRPPLAELLLSSRSALYLEFEA